MPTRDDIYTAIRNADKAGDAEAVRKLGVYLQTMDGHQARVSAQEAADRELYNPTKGMGTTERVLAGTGKAFADIARGAGQAVGLVSRGDVAESRQTDRPLMGTTAGKVGNALGNVAALAPAALVPGAGTIAGGSAVGGLLGLAQPSESTQETLLNTGLGAAGGAAVPLIQRGWRAAKAGLEPFYESGKNAILGRALNAAAGRDAPAVAQRLADASAPFVGPSQGTPRTVMGEFVPGSIPTVGQAAENAGVASLERAATATNPASTNAISDVMQAQNAARTGALRDTAGQGGQRDFFAAARDATSDQLYGAARRIGVDPAKLSPEALQNIAAFSKRVPDSVLNKARELAQIGGEQLTDATSVQGMHWVKMGIDDLIGQAKRQGNDTMARQLVGLQKDLLAGLDNLSPAYAAARQTHAAMSRPINQMDVAQSIVDKSIDPLTGNLRPGNYARALTDETAARATGLPSATLEGTMEPAQMNLLQSILLDARRANAAQNAGRGAGSDTVQKLAYTNLLEQAGVPTFLRDLAPAQVVGNITARGADMAYGRANRELGNRLAEVMLDPAAAAQLMRQATPAERNALMRLVSRGASGLSLSAPASANGQK